MCCRVLRILEPPLYLGFPLLECRLSRVLKLLDGLAGLGLNVLCRGHHNLKLVGIVISLLTEPGGFIAKLLSLL